MIFLANPLTVVKTISTRHRFLNTEKSSTALTNKRSTSIALIQTLCVSECLVSAIPEKYGGPGIKSRSRKSWYSEIGGLSYDESKVNTFHLLVGICHERGSRHPLTAAAHKWSYKLEETPSLWPRQAYGSGCSCPPSPASLSHVTTELRTVWHLEDTTRSSRKRWLEWEREREREQVANLLATCRPPGRKPVANVFLL